MEVRPADDVDVAMGAHGRMPRLYFVRMTYLARVRLDRIRARWRRPRQQTATQASAGLPIEPWSGPVGLAETIVLAAAGKARLEVSTVGVTLRTAPAMQRWVALERSTSDPLPTVAVIVQGHGRAVADIHG
jgi:hypothetical protein